MTVNKSHSVELMMIFRLELSNTDTTNIKSKPSFTDKKLTLIKNCSVYCLDHYKRCITSDFSQSAISSAVDNCFVGSTKTCVEMSKSFSSSEIRRKIWDYSCPVQKGKSKGKKVLPGQERGSSNWGWKDFLNKKNHKNKHMHILLMSTRNYTIYSIYLV